jgi:hypothetical protein
MGRVLVIYPLQGLLDMVRRVLQSRFDVDAFEQYQSAVNRLEEGAAYEAVLCGVDEPAWTIKIFEKAAARSARPRLIPIASDFIQFDGFKDQWDSGAQRIEKYGSIGHEWLRERFTVGDIHALFPPPAQELPNLPCSPFTCQHRLGPPAPRYCA